LTEASWTKAIRNGAAILSVSGVELAGWLPSELQNYFVFTGGVSTTAKEFEAGRALLTFLTTPQAVAVFKAKGLDPALDRDH
jgi:molybdate transport system substrate-binding protein